MPVLYKPRHQLISGLMRQVATEIRWFSYSQRSALSHIRMKSGVWRWKYKCRLAVHKKKKKKIKNFLEYLSGTWKMVVDYFNIWRNVGVANTCLFATFLPCWENTVLKAEKSTSSQVQEQQRQLLPLPQLVIESPTSLCPLIVWDSIFVYLR